MTTLLVKLADLTSTSPKLYDVVTDMTNMYEIFREIQVCFRNVT